MPDRARLTAAYAAAGGVVDDAAVRFHTALGHWKLACIAEGVLRRIVAGQYGDDAGGAAIGALVAPLAGRALDLLGG